MRLTLSQFVGNTRASIDRISIVPSFGSFGGARMSASQFHRGLAAWATVLRCRGVLAIGPNFSPLVEQAPDRGRHRGRPRSGPRDCGRLVLLFSVVHGRGLPSRSARPVQPQAPRRRAWSRLPVLSRLGRDLCGRERSAHPDLHELPSAREEGQRGARTDSGQRRQRPADALDSRPQASRLRLFRPQRARGGRNRLRHLPRPHRRDGNGHPDEAPQYELVPRLPPQPRSQQTPRLGGHQHEVDPSSGRRGARGAARARRPVNPPTDCSGCHR